MSRAVMTPAGYESTCSPRRFREWLGLRYGPPVWNGRHSAAVNLFPGRPRLSSAVVGNLDELRDLALLERCASGERECARCARGKERRAFLRHRRAVLARDPICHYCRARRASHADHVIPQARGGGNGIDNLAPACATCNLGKGGLTPREWLDVLDGALARSPRPSDLPMPLSPPLTAEQRDRLAALLRPVKDAE